MNSQSVYAIKVTRRCGLYLVSRISQDAYDSYDKAVTFIEERSDKPKRIRDYEWKSEEHIYSIVPLNVI